MDECCKKTLREFVKQVEMLAELNMLETGRLEGAHYNAMKTLMKKWEMIWTKNESPC